MRAFIAQIGYTDYLIQSEDLVKLLEIASRSKALDHSIDYTSHHLQKDPPPFVTTIYLGDITPRPADEPAETVQTPI